MHSRTPRAWAGLSVLLQYKLGSNRQGAGSAKYAVPALKWVGLRPSQLDHLDLPPQVRLRHEKVPLVYTAVCD